eukprot:TRINITY_DN12516_c0_g1_i1.p1 TRINITY_DN12516_c0_g1~~TRINITY_DN12516_c0_g1_i1.p1  ORF type:complete len:868 (+),score=274.42 TRINITY_DN12516_c0_g1_i1:59-2662(+)
MTWTDKNAEAADLLTEEEATLRFSKVKNVDYKIHLEMKQKTYVGHVTATLSLNEPTDLFFDFKGHQIKSIALNEKPLTTGFKYDSNRIYFEEGVLETENELVFEYENIYQNCGNGLHSFIDTVDNIQYVFSDLEPFNAHKIFPCFDQPDLKAQFSLSVIAPSEWTVVANYPVMKEPEKLTKKTSVWHFEQTPKLSTYLFAVIGGMYEVVSDMYDGRVPCNIYCRRSMKKYLDDDVIFTQTKQGLAFYEDFFDMQYPFAKYDQCFVPEYNWGAMENPGCITFNEAYLFKDKPSKSRVAKRCDTILHEMAHMWFGDLVTMKWWNDLWLNESFATFIASVAVSSATKFGDAAWLIFFNVMKLWAYRTDQLSTTHPIRGEVANTDATFNNFDGVTYGKGAAVLKQLVAVMGMDAFRNAMREYFKIYQFQNTNFDQFLEVLQKHSDFDLMKWAEKWLLVAGLNSIQCEYTLEDNKIKEFSVLQTAPANYPTLREHKIVIGLIHENGLIKEYPAHIDGEKTEISDLVGVDLTDVVCVFPNYGDHAYAKVILDERSLNFVCESLSEKTIPNDLLRLQLWNCVYNMVRDVKMSAQKYLNMIEKLLPLETNPKLVTLILPRVGACLNNFIPNKLVPLIGDRLFEVCKNQIAKSSEHDSRLGWTNAMLSCIKTKKATETALEMIDADLADGFKFQQAMRWRIMNRVCAFGLEGAKKMVAAELKKDSSDVGLRSVRTCNASYPNVEVKKCAWKEMLQVESKFSTHERIATGCGFVWDHQEEILCDYAEKYFTEIASIFQNSKYDKELAIHALNALKPPCSVMTVPAQIEKFKILLETDVTGGRSDVFKKHVKIIIDDLEREHACRQLVIETDMGELMR